MEPQKPPLVLSLVADLYFSVRIENAVGQAAGRVLVIDQQSQVAASPEQRDWKPSRTPEEQRVDAFITLVRAQQPVLIIVDLNNDAIPWRIWIPALKTSPPTRSIPIVAFGSHVNLDIQLAAKAAGADQVLAKSRFVQHLPSLIARYCSAQASS